MATKYFNSSVAGAAAVALISGAIVPSNGQAITIPGDSPSVFTFADVDPGGVTWIDTSSGDGETILANLLAALPQSQYTATPGAGTIDLVWNSVGLAANANVITATAPYTVSGFTGGLNASGAPGLFSDAANWWNDSGHTVPAGAIPLFSDNGVLQDDSTGGAGPIHDLSSAGGSVAGANITLYGTSTAVSSGSLIAAQPTPPTASQLIFGQTVQGVSGNQHVPTASQVLDTIPTGTATGNVTQPATNKVLSPAAGGPAGYGANGTQFVGTAPAASTGGFNVGGGVKF